MKQIGGVIAIALFLYNAVYAFIYWGFWWGVLNLFIPFSVIHDWVVRIGKF